MCIQVNNTSVHTYVHAHIILKICIKIWAPRMARVVLTSSPLCSMPIKVLILEKKFLNTRISWVYILDTWFVCPRYFLWAPKTHLPLFTTILCAIWSSLCELHQRALLPSGFEFGPITGYKWQVITGLKNNLFPHSSSEFGHISLPEGSSEFGEVCLPKNTASIRGGNASLRATAPLSQSLWLLLPVVSEAYSGWSSKQFRSTLDTFH